MHVVEQHPAAFSLAMAPYRLRAGAAHPLLDLVNDGTDLTVVTRGAEQERVGDDELLAHVVADDGVGKLVRGSLCGDPQQLHCVRCGGPPPRPSSLPGDAPRLPGEAPAF